MPGQSKKNLNKMFGGKSAEEKWKDEHSDHVNNYSANYYKANKAKIHAKRKDTRAKNKPNKFLGF